MVSDLKFFFKNCVKLPLIFVICSLGLKVFLPPLPRVVSDCKTFAHKGSKIAACKKVCFLANCVLEEFIFILFSCHLSPVTCHQSPFTCQLSPVTRHLSTVTYPLLFVTCLLTITKCLDVYNNWGRRFQWHLKFLVRHYSGKDP